MSSIDSFVALSVVGPSGSGKSTLCGRVLSEFADFRLSVSYTTRPPRAGEESGREYHFVPREKFETLIAEGEFLEHAEVYGNLYGTSKRWIEDRRASGADVLLEIDWQGARQVRKLFPDMTYIYILPPSIEVLRERLVKRGKDAADVIERRLAAAREDLRHIDNADYVIINQDFATALADLMAVVRSLRLTAARQIAKHAGLIAPN